MGRETFVWYPPVYAPQVYAFVDPVLVPQVYAYAPVEVVSVPRKIYGPYGPNTYGPY